MPTEPPSEHPAEPLAEAFWLPVAKAARHLGITEQAVRGRIKTGSIETKREVVGNRSRLLVRIDAPITQPVDPQLASLRDDVAKLNQHVRHLEEELAEARTERDVLRAVANERDQRLASIEAEVADLRAERDRLLALLERRRWPGLWPAVKRFLYGDA